MGRCRVGEGCLFDHCGQEGDCSVREEKAHHVCAASTRGQLAVREARDEGRRRAREKFLTTKLGRASNEDDFFWREEESM